jgi:ferredoxin-NADP reductase
LQRTSLDGRPFQLQDQPQFGLPITQRPVRDDQPGRRRASPSARLQHGQLSIKVPDGPLTSRLQHLQVGDSILVSGKPTGTLILDNLLPGRKLYLMATGTGLAPFLSIVKDPEVYERYKKVVLVHGCRQVAELAYEKLITHKNCRGTNSSANWFPDGSFTIPP